MFTDEIKSFVDKNVDAEHAIAIKKDAETPSKDVFLYNRLLDVDDPRHKRGKRYPLAVLLIMMVYAALAGATSGVDIALYVDLHKNRFMAEYHLQCVPSHDTFSRISQLFDPKNIEDIFMDWIYELFPCVRMQILDRDVFHVDGKAQRAVALKSKGEKPFFLLNGMFEGESIGLLSREIGDKKNEAGELPGYLELFDLHGTIVTIDAAGTTQRVIDVILGQGAFYVLPVKGNQRLLQAAVESELAKMQTRPAIDEKGEVIPDTTEYQQAIKYHDESHDHGRTEIVDCMILGCTDKIVKALGKDVSFYGSIANIAVIDKTVIRPDENNGKPMFKRRVLITNLPEIKEDDVMKILHAHWHIEMEHWRLDIQLREDAMTARKGHAMMMGAFFRRFSRLVQTHSPNPEDRKMTIKEFNTRNYMEIDRIDELLHNPHANNPA